jgi:hypothetical protein
MPKGKSSKREPLVVASKVRAYIRSKNMMTSSESFDAINQSVYQALDAAAVRAKANRRSTVRPQDF